MVLGRCCSKTTFRHLWHFFFDGGFVEEWHKLGPLGRESV